MIDFFFVFIFGLVTSFYDIKYKKVSNKCIMIALLAGVIITSFLVFQKPVLLFDILLNVMIMFILGFGLWYVGFWPAGDAKLMTAYALLIPTSIYDFKLISFFPSFAIFINSFLLAFFALTIFNVRSFRMETLAQEVKNIFSFERIVSKVLYLLGFYWVFNQFILFIGMPSDPFLNLAVMIIIFPKIKKLFASKTDVVMAIFVIIRIVFAGSVMLSYSFWIGFFEKFVLFVFGYLILISLTKRNFTIEKRIIDLAPGMMPVETFERIKDIDNKKGRHHYKKVILEKSMSGKGKEILFDSSPDDFRRYHNVLFLRRAGGLAEWDIREMLYRLENGLLDSDRIKVQETISFAPVLFVGVLLTYFFKGNFLTYLLVNFFA
ncbi:MAG: prepilin peptidase [Candidatus Diapherotrites archaeon]|nr:prepilin peptidase [Candidatus Diapherotrites archaeon]